jgi:phytoene synthase
MSRSPLEDCFEYCEQLTKRTAGNFYYSFCGLPSEQYRGMCVLYAFMRVTDDCGDDATRSVTQRIDDLDGWKQSLVEVLRTDWTDREMRDWPEPAGHVLPALRVVVEKFAIPHEYLFAVVRGVRSDLEFERFDVSSQISDLKSPVARFQTFDQLADYCYLVAGAVGLCCIHIWGFHGDAAIARAIDCGTAFQLTNILRDVGEDARSGRIYLPGEDLERFGVSAEDLVAGRLDDRFRSLMSFEAERAHQFYARAKELLPCLEPHGRPILKAMLQLYGGLLHEIERRKYEVFRQHIALPRWRKLWIAADALIHQKLLPKG